MAVLTDQEYEKLEKMNNPTCQEKRDAASLILDIDMPTNGDWSDEFGEKQSKVTGHVHTMKRPRLYYFVMLDCDRNLNQVFKSGQVPRLVHEIHMTTEDGWNEFSYEDMGSLGLYFLLFMSLGVIYLMMIKTFK